ncbi:MAG: dockerin type I domain-containing protein [Planctomycetota bacterium]|jgi:hypothetical protein
MKSLVFVAAVVGLAASAPAEVLITCDYEDATTVAVSFDATSEPNRVRAFALDVSVGEGSILNVSCVSPDYYIYPGSIVIEEGIVTDWGSCLCDVVPANSITVEMRSMYMGEANAPAKSGVLFTFTVDTDTVSDVTITQNAGRCGVIMENPDEIVAVTIVGCGPCWYPPCWDSPTQCHGDVDETGDVKGSDLIALKNCWYTGFPDPGYLGCACCDFNRDGKVDGADWLIMKNNWYQSVVPDCAPGDLNHIFCP